MKNLNLFIGIFISILFLTSCSKDKDSDNDSLVGTWKPIREVDVCSTGSEDIYEYSVCQQKSRYVFKNDGTLTINEYDDENSSGNCIEDYSLIGTWILNENKLTLTIAGETDTPTFFKLTSNNLKVGYYDSDANDPCDGGNLPSHYYTELVRVK